MCDKEINVRDATTVDCEDIYAWRKDPVSVSMFLNTSIPSYEEHESWFQSSLNSPDCALYIGEIGPTKIGVCRFDRNAKNSTVEVSINLNPGCRGNGFGRRLLACCIEIFAKNGRNELIARIKEKNLPSLKIFKSVGFHELFSRADVITLVKCDKKITFKEVGESDTGVLFEILKQRAHFISHDVVPTMDEHIAFFKSKPYRYWALILEDDAPVGTMYLQDDNSVGLNLNEPSLRLVSGTLTYIRENFKPRKEKKSKVPPYFYVNVAYSNENIGSLLMTSDALPIQISYKF